MKHPGFHEERERRVVYSPNRQRSALIEQATETIGGVPQVVHKLPLDKSVLPDLEIGAMFDRLIVGPTPYPWAVANAFIVALTAAGVPSAETRVCVSTIPIRG
jgi:hypothetical protein